MKPFKSCRSGNLVQGTKAIESVLPQHQTPHCVEVKHYLLCLPRHWLDVVRVQHSEQYKCSLYTLNTAIPCHAHVRMYAQCAKLLFPHQRDTANKLYTCWICCAQFVHNSGVSWLLAMIVHSPLLSIILELFSLTVRSMRTVQQLRIRPSNTILPCYCRGLYVVALTDTDINTDSELSLGSSQHRS